MVTAAVLNRTVVVDVVATECRKEKMKKLEWKAVVVVGSA